MSHPILYDAAANNFSHLGLGVLKDAISCIVTEERNGVFELEMKYPITGIHFEHLKTDNIIKVDAGHANRSKEQRFRIKRIDKKSSGVAEVYAQHVSYITQDLALQPNMIIHNMSAQNALNIWRNAIIGNNPLTVTSDITTLNSTNLKLGDYENARQVLGGIRGSILDVWGGEYVFDNHHVSLLTRRGGDANTLIAYGRNLIDLNQEENITTTFTSVYPYAIYQNPRTNTEEVITISGFIMDSQHVNAFPNRRVLPLDFSNEFNENQRPTPDRLRQLAERYIRSNDVGVPRVSISLSFVDLTKALGYTGSRYEQLNLCDTVPVRFEQLGIETRARIIRIEWNVLLDRYERIEVGESRPNLSSRMRRIEHAINEVNTNANFALTAANGKNTVFFGTSEPPPPRRAGDLWYRPNGEHTELWTWNGSAWEFVLSTAPDQVLIDKIEAAMKEVREALDELKNTLLPELQKDLDKLNDLDLAELRKEVEELNGARIPAMQATLVGVQDALSNLDLDLSDAREDIKKINDVELPKLRQDLDALNNVTLPNLQTELNALKTVELANLQTELNRVNSTTIPALRQDLNRLTQETMPSVQRELNDLEFELNGLTDLTDGWRFRDTVEIDGGALRANTITTNHMAANSIHGDRVTTNTLNANRIVANSITGNQIAANAVSASHITSNAITADKIAAGAVTTDKMAANSINGDRVTTNTLNANRIVAGSIATDRMAANSINGDRIAANTLDANRIVAGSITTDRMTANSINGNRITANTLAADRLVANSITGAQIAANAITAGMITSGTMHGDRITTNTLNGNRIVANTISGDHIVANSMHGNRVVANSMHGDRIVANTITADRLAANTITADSAAIASLNASRITAGTLNAANVNVINLNGNSITVGSLNGNRIQANTITANHLSANAIQVGFNNMGNTLSLSSTDLTISSGGVRHARLGGSGLSFWDGTTRVGSFRRTHLVGQPTVRGISNMLETQGDFIMWDFVPSASSPTTTPALLLDMRGRYTGRTGIHCYQRMNMRELGTRGFANNRNLIVGITTISGTPRTYIGDPSYESGIAFSSTQCFLIDNNIAYRVRDLAR